MNQIYPFLLNIFVLLELNTFQNIENLVLVVVQLLPRFANVPTRKTIKLTNLKKINHLIKYLMKY